MAEKGNILIKKAEQALAVYMYYSNIEPKKIKYISHSNNKVIFKAMDDSERFVCEFEDAIYIPYVIVSSKNNKEKIDLPIRIKEIEFDVYLEETEIYMEEAAEKNGCTLYFDIDISNSSFERKLSMLDDFEKLIKSIVRGVAISRSLTMIEKPKKVYEKLFELLISKLNISLDLRVVYEFNKQKTLIEKAVINAYCTNKEKEATKIPTKKELFKWFSEDDIMTKLERIYDESLFVSTFSKKVKYDRDLTEIENFQEEMSNGLIELIGELNISDKEIKEYIEEIVYQCIVSSLKRDIYLGLKEKSLKIEAIRKIMFDE